MCARERGALELIVYHSEIEKKELPPRMSSRQIAPPRVQKMRPSRPSA